MKQQTSEQLLQQIHEYIGSLSYMRNPMGLYMCWGWVANVCVRF